jgi:hypothetical protein
MSLSLADLEKHYYELCMYWASLNGSNALSISAPTPTVVLRRRPAGQNPVILAWNHDSPQPTDAQLRGLNLTNAIALVKRVERGGGWGTDPATGERNEVTRVLLDLQNQIRALRLQGALTLSDYITYISNLG